MKGLYQRARAGQIEGFTGVSDPYEEPLSAELVIDTEQEPVDESVAKLVALSRSGSRGPSRSARRV